MTRCYRRVHHAPTLLNWRNRDFDPRAAPPLMPEVVLPIMMFPHPLMVGMLGMRIWLDMANAWRGR